MKKYLLGCVALGASLALVACGGSSTSNLNAGGAAGSGGTGTGGSGGTGTAGSGGAAGASGMPLSDLPGKLASAYCALYDKCYGPLVSAMSSGEDCVATTTKSIEDGGFSKLQGEIDAGKVVYNGDKAQGCLDAIAATSCDQLLHHDQPACDAALDGTVPIGGDCSIDADCKGQAYCKAGAACPGKCTALESAGGNCQADEQCQDGLSCDKNTKKCVQPAAKGQACQGGTEPDCAPPYICIGSDTSKAQTGTCMDWHDVLVNKAGQSCDVTNFKWCENADPCVIQSVSATGTITAMCGQKVAAGAACKAAVPDQCPTGQYCKLQPQSVDGTCTPLPTSGQACAGISSSTCAANLRCDKTSQTCKPLQKLGEACSGDQFCYSGYCSSGGCAPPGCSP